MKENIKIGLLGIIALASVVNIFMLSSISEKQEEMSETQSSVVANTVPGNNAAANPLAPPTPAPVDPNAGTNMPPPDMKKTTIQWGKMVHDFGKIKQNSTNTYSFEFTNTGNTPLLITDAKGSCGCTVPDYPKEPIAPGKSGKINVEYKPGAQENQQEKMVTVTANTDPVQTQLKIRAFVEK